MSCLFALDASSPFTHKGRRFIEEHQTDFSPSSLSGKFLRRVPVGNAENANSAIEQFTYIGDIYDDLERAKLSVFATIVQEPLFDDLRAKQQLGYIVSPSPSELRALEPC